MISSTMKIAVMTIDQNRLPPGMKVAYANDQIARNRFTEKNEYRNPSIDDQPLTRPLALRTNSVCSPDLLASVAIS